MPLKAVAPYEGRWELLDTLGAPATQPFPDKFVGDFVGDAEEWAFLGDNVEQTGAVAGEGPPPPLTPPVNGSTQGGKPKRDQKPGRAKS